MRKLLAENSRQSFLWRVVLFVLIGGWAYWPTLSVMATKWSNSPEYSHGYLVPLFSIGFLWTRRSALIVEKLRINSWGLILIGGAMLVRWASGRFYMESLDLLSFVPFLAGVVLLCGGWHAFRWSLPGIAFLLFMLPLPFSLEVALRGPLRQIGTSASTYVMQTLGLPAVAEGNIIVVGDARIGVTEACSGLSMLMVFFAFSTATAMFIHDRPVWEKILVVASAIPIAIFANVTRITVTGLLYATGNGTIADAFFHDFAGWLMIPLAFAILWVELEIVSRMVVVADDAPMVFGVKG